MSVLDLDTATATYDCKIANCDRQAKSNRGRYAYLCDVHTEEQRDAFSRQIAEGIARKAAGDEPSATESRSDATGDRAAALATGGLSVAENGSAAPPDLPSISAAADRIPALARRVEDRLLHRRAAREEARDAIRVLNDALGELRAAVQALA